MKYIVSVALDARLDVEVEASSFEEAKLKAPIAAGNENWNRCDLVSLTPVNAEDENGMFIDY